MRKTMEGGLFRDRLFDFGGFESWQVVNYLAMLSVFFFLFASKDCVEGGDKVDSSVLCPNLNLLPLVVHPL